MNILVAHADLTARGGAESYAEALIARLRARGHSVGVLDINGLRHGNRHTRPALFRLGTLPVLRHLSLWKYALVCRALPRLARAFDGVVLSYGEGPDTARPTLRILHAPVLFGSHPKLLAFLGARAPFWPRRLYAGLCRWVARPATDPARTHSLANSRWTARIAARVHRIPRPQVLYPQVRPQAIAPQTRDPHAMVMIGRIVPNKRIEDGIALTNMLRARGLPATLTVIGRADSAHARSLIAAHANTPHIRFLPDAAPHALQRALAAATLGLHFYRHEHFGIAVAEMITAGLIPLVYDGGGVRELVPDRALRFRSVALAATAAQRVMAASQDTRARQINRLQTTDALTRACTFEDCADAALASFLDTL